MANRENSALVVFGTFLMIVIIIIGSIIALPSVAGAIEPIKWILPETVTHDDNYDLEVGDEVGSIINYVKVYYDSGSAFGGGVGGYVELHPTDPSPIYVSKNFKAS